MEKVYYLTYEEVNQVVDRYGITITEKNDSDFIESHRDLIDRAMDNDAKASAELWEIAQREGFLDDYLDRDVLDTTETFYGIEQKEYPN